MAIITFAAPLSGIRGTIGGITYSANKAGPYIRSRGIPSNPKSLKQGNQRSVLADEAQAWATLTPTQQAGWDTLAGNPIMARINSLGDTYELSGFGMFCAINCNRVTTGQARRTTAPAAASQNPPSAITLTIQPAGSGGSSFVFTPPQLTPNKFMVCFLTFGRSEGVNVRYSNFRLLIVLDSADTSPVTITNELDALFGDPIVGYKYFIDAAIQTNNGIRSVRAQFTGVAA